MTVLSNFSNQVFTYETIILTDELTGNTSYIGTSINSNNPSAACWRIKKVWKDGTVWRTEYPNGDQSYSFVWNSRAGYTYQ
ncbi:MAG: hypothetical protein WC428_00465 [Candidatus Paceibacterota bacterium]